MKDSQDLFFKNWKNNITYIFVVVIILAITVILQPTKNFPDKIIDIHVQKSSSISMVADELYNKNMISSKLIFKALTTILSKNHGILAGDYKFIKPQGIFTIAYRMTYGEQGQPKITITIPEGTNVNDMAYIFLNKLPGFNAPYFLAKAKKYEGYLFPDTYYFLANVTPDEIISEMRGNFEKKIAEYKPLIEQSGRTYKDIIIMASIVEEEAKSLEDKRMVAGVLWNRIDNNMFLQVDPPFYFITGKTNGVTYDDLKIDSPYNTYKYKGLPIGPISNPGIKSIIATINPIPTKYFFYLTGNDGVMRYAINYSGHLNNKTTYLK